MRVRHALIGFGVVTFFYLLALLFIDSRNHVLTELPKLLSVLPTLMSLSLLSYLVRYLRWYWLLYRAHNKTKFFFGLLAYLSGFAFTATPGKVGELLRIRYLAPQGIPPWRVLSAFVYERAFDLVAVLMISALAITRTDLFFLAVGIVVTFLVVLVFAALNPCWLTRVSVYLRFHRLKKFSRICVTLRDGLSGCCIWATPLDFLVSFIFSLVACGLTAYSFVLVLIHLGVLIPTLSAFSIYPLSMLAGAASMLPGGVGSTEVTIVGMLLMFDVPLGTAALAAVGIRFSTMWFATLCGFFALFTLEFLFPRVNLIRSP